MFANRRLQKLIFYQNLLSSKHFAMTLNRNQLIQATNFLREWNVFRRDIPHMTIINCLTNIPSSYLQVVLFWFYINRNSMDIVPLVNRAYQYCLDENNYGYIHQQWADRLELRINNPSEYRKLYNSKQQTDFQQAYEVIQRQRMIQELETDGEIKVENRESELTTTNHKLVVTIKLIMCLLVVLWLHD